MHNPAGTNGFEFLEFTTDDPSTLAQQFTALGFKESAQHHTLPITIYQQNDIRFIINIAKTGMAHEFARAHGPSTSAMGFRVANAKKAYDHAILNGAKAYTGENPYNIPAIYGVGNSLIYFIEHQHNVANYAAQFSLQKNIAAHDNSVGLMYLDHVTHNLYRGNMIKWADFYTKIFNFREIRYFDIEGKVTGLVSKAMTSPCGKIRIPLNESADDQSQIEEFLRDFKGEGIQHIALGSSEIYHSVAQLSERGIEFLDTPDSYFDLIEKRLPQHGEPLAQLKKHRILIDGDTQNAQTKKLLLQIFTKNMLGPAFFEIIQRKGDEGFGEGNFRALFESIELEQIRRGVIQVESETA